MNGERWMAAAAVVMLVLGLALLALSLAEPAGADGPVLWKQFCPRSLELVYVWEKDGSGVHVVCVMADAAEEVGAAGLD